MILSAINEYRHYFQKMELGSLKNYFLNGFDMLYKNGNFYCINDDGGGRMMLIGVTYDWFCRQYCKLIGVEWVWPVKWDDVLIPIGVPSVSIGDEDFGDSNNLV